MLTHAIYNFLIIHDLSFQAFKFQNLNFNRTSSDSYKFNRCNKKKQRVWRVLNNKQLCTGGSKLEGLSSVLLLFLYEGLEHLLSLLKQLFQQYFLSSFSFSRIALKVKTLHNQLKEFFCVKF